jgi:hypothetical protein
MDNKNLYARKQRCLEELSFREAKTDHIFSVLNVSFSIICKNKKILSLISSLVLAGELEKLSFSLELVSPEQYGFTEEEWTDEESQDCYFIDDNIRAVIHRDFIAKEIVPGKYSAVISATNSDSFYNLLRWLLPPILLRKNRVIAHSSAVLNRKQEALVFLGHSGAGKTTITKLGEKNPILGDDMNSLFWQKGKLLASPGGVGGAFVPTVPLGSSYPVRAFFWLRQAEMNRAVMVNKAEAMQYLVSSLVGWNWSDIDSTLVQQLLQWSRSVVEQTPIYILEFRKDRSIWNYLEELL